MSSPERYTGIIRTLPYFGAGDTREDLAKKKAHERMMIAFKRMARGKDDQHVRIAFSVKPRYEVLHCYILVGGLIWVRANISHWQGKANEKVTSSDGHDLSDAKFWCILTAPVSFPERPIERRGFQGIRYVKEPLW